MRDFIDFIRRNYVLQILLGIILFMFYVHVFNSVAAFYNIQASSYMNYMFFFAVLAILYMVLPQSNRSFI